MKGKKIENIESFQEAKEKLNALKIIEKGVNFFSFFGIKKKDVSEVLSQLTDMEKEFNLISKTPDKFNNFFSQKGWIAHESMNSELMVSSVKLAESGRVEEAEQKLTDYYSSNEIEWHVQILNTIEAFSIRSDFFQFAYGDTISGRYYSAIPILLMMIDGVVNDINKDKGFFAERAALEAWDSIAAHSTGLLFLKDLFNSGRNKTTSEDIFLPYRNGILHGRDLGYANKIVLAKCWAAVFAVRDWAAALENNNKRTNIDPEKSFIETFEDLANHNEKSKKLDDKLKKWKSRNLEIGADVPRKGKSEDYKDFSPEQEAVRFVEYWKNKNYGKIATQVKRFKEEPLNIKKEAGRIRRIFEDKNIIDFEIVKIVDCAPVISEVTMNISVLFDDKTFNKEITIRLIFEDEGGIVINGDNHGKWEFLEFLFFQIETIGF